MPTTEDIARLKLETVGVESLDPLRTKMTQVKAEIYEFADSYEVVETAAAQAAGAINRSDLRPFWASDEASQATQKAAAGLDRVNEAAQKTQGGTSALQQRVTAAGYAFQDFTATSGDMGAKLNSISNNIPQLLAGMGGLATGVSIAVTAGIALYRNWDSIAGLFEERNPVPKVAGDVKGLDAALKDNNQELDDLRSKTSLSNDQLARFNELTAKQTELEKELAAARETEKNRQAHTELTNEAAKARATGVGKALDVAGGYDKVIADLTRQAQEEQGVKDTDVTRLNAIRESFQKALNDALKGDEKALSALQFYTSRATGGGAATALDIGLQTYSPEAEAGRKKEEEAEKKRQKAEDDKQRLNDQLREQGAQNEQATKEEEQKRREAKDKLTEELTAQGQENYRISQEEEAKRKETGTKAEAKRIEDTVGKQRQLQYEGLMAENAAAFQAGAPGAVAPQVMARRLQAQMVGEFRQRGAAPESAAMAAKSIAGAGQQDLMRRQSLVAGRIQGTQGQMLQLTHDLMAELMRLDGTQQAINAEVSLQRQEVRGMRGRSKSRLPRTTR